MFQAVYYDSCIFMQASNHAHSECTACGKLLTPSFLSWEVIFCRELTVAETSKSVGELVEFFEISCAQQGVIARNCEWSQANRLRKKHKATRKKLESLGLQGHDFNHLMCAVHESAEAIATTDMDFWDPKIKGAKKQKKPPERVRKLIKASLQIEVILPSELT